MFMGTSPAASTSLKGSTLWLESGAELREHIGPALLAAMDTVVDRSPVALSLMEWLAVLAEGRLGVSATSEDAAAVVRRSPSADSGAPAPPPQPLSLADLRGVTDWLLEVTLVLRAVWVRCRIDLRRGWDAAAPFDEADKVASLDGAADRAAPVATRVARWAHTVCAPTPVPRYAFLGVTRFGACVEDTGGMAAGEPGALHRTLGAACAVYLRGEATPPASSDVAAARRRVPPALLEAAMHVASPAVLGKLAVSATPTETDPPMPPSAAFGRLVVPSRVVSVVLSVAQSEGSASPAHHTQPATAVACLPSAVGRAYWGRGRGAGDMEAYFKAVEVQLYHPGAQPGCACPGCDKVGTPAAASAEAAAGAPVFQRCGRCRFVWYCSRDCQAKAWKAGHKARCKWLAPVFKDARKFSEFDATSKMEWVAPVPMAAASPEAT